MKLQFLFKRQKSVIELQKSVTVLHLQGFRLETIFVVW